MKATPEIERMFSDLKEEIIWLHCDWKQYRALFGTNADRVEILNATAGIFFHDIHDLYLNYITLRISRLVDRRRDVISLRQLFNDLKKQNHNNLAEIQSMSRSLLKIEQMSKPFEDRRSNRIAHRSKKIAFGIEMLPGISRQMVEDVLEEVRTFMNLFSVTVQDTELDFELLGMNTDAEALMTALKKALLYDELISSGQVPATHFKESYVDRNIKRQD